MRKLHITILDFDDIRNPLLGAGQAWATYEVGQRLIKKGHKITILSSKYPGFLDRFEKGMYYKHIGLGSKNIKLNNFVYILLVNLYVLRLKSDIILECFTAPISTLFSPLFTKIPVVGLPSMFAADEFSKKYHLPFSLVEKIGARFYRYFLPYTKQIDIKMKKLNKNITSRIVPEGVGDYYFKFKKRKPKHILFLGRFDIDQKGIDLLIKSYALISKKTRYPLVIAGHGPDEKKIRSLIKTLSLESKVKLVGSAYGEKKRKLLESAICVAFPSRREGFSLFFLEVLAAGVPILTFDLNELSWINELFVYKTKAFDTVLYSKQMLKLTKEKHNKQFFLNEKKFAKQFSWNNVVNEYESFFYLIKNK